MPQYEEFKGLNVLAVSFMRDMSAVTVVIGRNPDGSTFPNRTRAAGESLRQFGWVHSGASSVSVDFAVDNDLIAVIFDGDGARLSNSRRALTLKQAATFLECVGPRQYGWGFEASSVVRRTNDGLRVGVDVVVTALSPIDREALKSINLLEVAALPGIVGVYGVVDGEVAEPIDSPITFSVDINSGRADVLAVLEAFAAHFECFFDNEAFSFSDSDPRADLHQARLRELAATEAISEGAPSESLGDTGPQVT